jgi:heme/copper-type cytochrome/quinol oxidase subunit 2
MNPMFRKAALIAAVLGFAVSVFVAACGSDDGESASSTTTTATTTQAATTAPATTEETPTTTEDGGATTPPITGPASSGQTITIRVVGGRPQGGIQRPKVQQGERVTLVVTSDVADEIHVHGYDVSADAAPGSPARLSFDAEIPGRFEVELEERGVQIAELTVEP